MGSRSVLATGFARPMWERLCQPPGKGALASFLVEAGPNCYFCYTRGWLGEYVVFSP